jgi:hypothetical protein
MARLVDVPGGQLELIPRGSEVPDPRRDFLLAQIARVVDTNWRSTKASWWSREHSPFHDDFGMAFFHAAQEIVGYFIYKRFHLDGLPVFYGAGTAVDRRHQGRRCYQAMLVHALTDAWGSLEPIPNELYIAWRTRNPAIWISNSRLCRVLAPSLWDARTNPKLEDACIRLAQELYPECPIEPPAMIMHHVFDNLIEIRKPRRGPSGSMSARLAEMLANPADAIFSLGIVERATLDRLRSTVRGQRRRHGSAAPE